MANTIEEQINNQIRKYIPELYNLYGSSFSSFMKKIEEIINSFTSTEGRLKIKIKKDCKAIEYKDGELIIPFECLIRNVNEQNLGDKNFKYFLSEMQDIDFYDILSTDDENEDFIKFAGAIGCFSNDMMLDKNGNPTQVQLCQKATTTLRDMMGARVFGGQSFHDIFFSLPIGLKPDQDFFNFISHRSNKKEFDNLKMLLHLNRYRYNQGIFVKVMTNFEEAKKHRVTLKNGRPVTVPWKDAILDFYSSIKYEGVTDENRDIAELFAETGVSQEAFDDATFLREQAKEDGVPEHILGKPLREESILESIERIKEKTKEELRDVEKIIEELYDRKFTYEWLSKNDPHNSIIGLFCSCCANITGWGYGKRIAEASIIAQDVQNIVVRDINGEIISKGTMYINKDEGYAVINDFELNDDYKKHERKIGYYEVDENNKEEQDREQIFRAFQRGLKAFIEEYDRQNPYNPIRQVNIGIGYNRLRRQVDRYKKATESLSVPIKYGFLDASEGQYILYSRENDMLCKKLEQLKE